MGVKKIMRAWTARVLFKQVDPIGLAVFRVLYTLVLFCELAQLYTFRHVIFDLVPFRQVGEINVEYLFVFWSCALLCMLVGFQTRLATVLNYVFSVIIFSSAGRFEYHIFYIYVAVSFVLMVIPLSAALSVDRFLAKSRWAAKSSAPFPRQYVLAINYLAPVLVGIGFVYLDSVLYKIDNSIWHKGLGMWLPASLPMMTWYDGTFFLDMKWLMVAFSHLVVLFEVLFILIFWMPRFRVPCMVLGVLFHIGILVEFPIPWFALATIALYTLLAPTGWWRRLEGVLTRRRPALELHYPIEDPMMRTMALRIRALDLLQRIDLVPVAELDALKAITRDGRVLLGEEARSESLRTIPWAFPLGAWVGGRKNECDAVPPAGTSTASHHAPSAQLVWAKTVGLGRRGWMVLLLVLCSFQGIVSLDTPIGVRSLDGLDGDTDLLVKTSGKLFHITKPFRKPFLGITHHPLFLDAHFYGYEHLIKVEHVKEDGTRALLPLTQENGMPGEYVRGSIWAHYGFRINSATVDLRKIEEVERYIDHFRYTELEEPMEGHSEVSMKRIEVPKEWERGFLRRQMEKPWYRVGEYRLQGPFKGFLWTDEMLDLAHSESK